MSQRSKLISMLKNKQTTTHNQLKSNNVINRAPEKINTSDKNIPNNNNIEESSLLISNAKSQFESKFKELETISQNTQKQLNDKINLSVVEIKNREQIIILMKQKLNDSDNINNTLVSENAQLLQNITELKSYIEETNKTILNLENHTHTLSNKLNEQFRSILNLTSEKKVLSTQLDTNFKLNDVSKVIENEDDVSKVTENEDDVSKVTENEDYVSKVTENEDDVSKVIENEDDVSKVTENEDYVSKVTENEDDIIEHNIIKKQYTIMDIPNENTTDTIIDISDLSKKKAPRKTKNDKKNKK
jgi:hypothetical protein